MNAEVIDGSVVQQLQDMQPEEIPEHLQKEDATREAGDFDPNSYFKVLKHLSMRPGYVLDYVYQFDPSFGGLPRLYARPVCEQPLRSAEEYEHWRTTNSLLNFLETDDSAAGFFELAVFLQIAGQFYLFWHANYNDHRIVCDGEALETILTSPNDFGNLLSDGVIEQARALDVEPLVVFDDETVRVQVLLFTKWGGFSRATFTISRDFPHQIEAVKSETLVPYDCGVMF